MQTGGVKATYLTEAKLTMFHNFWTRKMLGEGETPEDFMEVTAAQKAAFEKAEAEWVRPPQAFIDFWNSACYKDGIGAFNKTYEVGRYNEETGYFELNNLYDITYPQALKVAKCSYYGAMAQNGDAMNCYFRCNPGNTWLDPRTAAFARTYFPINTLAYSIDLGTMFQYNNIVESVRFFGGHGATAGCINGMNAFTGCTNLRFVLGFSEINAHARSAFQGCVNLEDFAAWRIGWATAIYLGDSPKFSRERLLSWVKTGSRMEGICTITVHPTLYAKIMDETNNEWHQLYTLGLEKNIVFATP